MKQYLKLYIKFCKNNIHANLSKNNKTLFKTSFKINTNSSNKSTQVQIFVENLSFFLKKLNIDYRVLLFIEGYHILKYYTLKSMQINKINFFKIYHVSKTPFNGCQLKKSRRL